MYLLDTDHISLIQRGGAEGQRILAKLTNFREDEIGVTVITYEEQIKGWLKALSAAKRREETAFGYLGLKQTARDFCSIEILSFDLAAIAQYENLRATYRRLGQNDLKIAAIVLTHNATLLTRNQKDFGQIQGVKIEDWSGSME
jgi:tRNA(fMet)-specific endonuclease VapC